MPYEVQHHTLTDGWINTWYYAEADGLLRPEIFATEAVAQAALDEFFADLDEEIAAGHILPYARLEFRIEHVPPTHTEPTKTE